MISKTTNNGPIEVVQVPRKAHIVCGAREERGGGLGPGENKGDGIAIDFFTVHNVVFRKSVDEVIATILRFVVQATVDGCASVAEHVVSNDFDRFWHEQFHQLP